MEAKVKIQIHTPPMLIRKPQALKVKAVALLAKLLLLPLLLLPTRVRQKLLGKKDKGAGSEFAADGSSEKLQPTNNTTGSNSPTSSNGGGDNGNSITLNLFVDGFFGFNDRLDDLNHINRSVRVNLVCAILYLLLLFARLEGGITGWRAWCCLLAATLYLTHVFFLQLLMKPLVERIETNLALADTRRATTLMEITTTTTDDRRRTITVPVPLQLRNEEAEREEETEEQQKRLRRHSLDNAADRRSFYRLNVVYYSLFSLTFVVAMFSSLVACFI